MKRGEIWTVAGGRDYAGKPRPVVILQDDRFDATQSITICAFTTDRTEAPLFRLPIEPDDRKGAFKTASPVEFIERRPEPSPHAEELEKYIHSLLEPRRVKHRRELFDATMEEVTEAFERAIPIVNETQRLIAEADAVGKKKPSNDVVLDASPEVLELYEQLRRAWRDEQPATISEMRTCSNGSGNRGEEDQHQGTQEHARKVI